MLSLITIIADIFVSSAIIDNINRRYCASDVIYVISFSKYRANNAIIDSINRKYFVIHVIIDSTSSKIVLVCNN